MPALLRAVRRRPAARSGALAFLICGFALPRTAMCSGPDESVIQQRTWSPNSAAEAFAGEIHTEFDTALNTTSVRFVVALHQHGVLRKIFLSTPAVHTVVASYRFAGMPGWRVPDRVRVSLKSDEITYETSDTHPMPPADAFLTFEVGGHRRAYPVVIAQRTTIAPKAEARNRDPLFSRGISSVQTSTPPLFEIHVARSATALLPLCDFLDVANEAELHGSVAGLAFALDREAMGGLREFALQITVADARQTINCPSK